VDVADCAPKEANCEESMILEDRSSLSGFGGRSHPSPSKEQLS
jgi:exonuclease VII large subunit